MATPKKQPATDRRGQDSTAPAIRPALAQGLNLLVRPDSWGRVSAITQTISRVLAYNHLTTTQQSLPRRLSSNRVLSNRVVQRYGQFYSQLGPLNRSVRYRRRKNAPLADLTDAAEDTSPDYDLSEPEAPAYEFAEPAAQPVLRREYRPSLERPRLGDALPAPRSFYPTNPLADIAFTNDAPVTISRSRQESAPVDPVTASPTNREIESVTPFPASPTNQEIVLADTASAFQGQNNPSPERFDFATQTSDFPISQENELTASYSAFPAENKLLAGHSTLGGTVPAEARFAGNAAAAPSTLQRLLTNLQRVNETNTNESPSLSADLIRPASFALNYARRSQTPGRIARSPETTFGFEPGTEAAFAGSFAPQPGPAREITPPLSQPVSFAQEPAIAPPGPVAPSQFVFPNNGPSFTHEGQVRPDQPAPAATTPALPAESSSRNSQAASTSGEAVITRTVVSASADSLPERAIAGFNQDSPAFDQVDTANATQPVTQPQILTAAQSGQAFAQHGRPVLQRQAVAGLPVNQPLADQAGDVTGEFRPGMGFSGSIAQRPAMGSWAGTLAALQFNPALANSTVLRSFQPASNENVPVTPASFASEPAQRMVWHALHRNLSTVRREINGAAIEQPLTSLSENSPSSPVSLANSEPLVFSPALARSQAMLTTGENGQTRVEMPPLLQRAVVAPEVATMPGTGLVDRRQAALQQVYNAEPRASELGAVSPVQAGQLRGAASVAPARFERLTDSTATSNILATPLSAEPDRIARLTGPTGPTPLQRLMQQAASLSDEAVTLAQPTFEAQPGALSYARPAQLRRVQTETTSNDGEAAFESLGFESGAVPVQPIQRYYQPQAAAQETVQRFEQVSRPGVLSGLLPGAEPTLPTLSAAPRVDRWGAALPALQFNPGVTTQSAASAELIRSIGQSVVQTGANVTLARSFAGDVTRQDVEEAYQAGWEPAERNLAAPGQGRRNRTPVSEEAYQVEPDAVSRSETGQVQASAGPGIGAGQESLTVQRQVNQDQSVPVEQADSAGGVVNETNTGNLPAQLVQRNQTDGSGETQERLSGWLARSVDEGVAPALGGERLRLNNPTHTQLERELAEPGSPYSEPAVDGGLVYRQPGRSVVRSARAETNADFAGETSLSLDAYNPVINSNEQAISPAAANSLLRQVQRTLANSQAEVSQRLNGFLARVNDESALPKIGGERLRLGWMEAEASAAQPGNETVQRTLRLGQPGSRAEQPSYNDMSDGLNGDLAYTRPPLIERRAGYQRPVEGDEGATASPNFDTAVANLMAELGLDNPALGGGDTPTIQRTRSEEGAWSADEPVRPTLSSAAPDGAAVWKPLDLSYADPPKLEQREPPRKPNLGNSLEARSGVLPGLKLATQANRDERSAPTGFQPASMVLRNSVEPGSQGETTGQDSQPDSSAPITPGDAPLSTYFEGPAERPIGVMGLPQLPMIQRKATGSGPAQVQRSFDTLMRSSVGQPLHSGVQSRMSGMFGNRFEQVKVHTDNVAGDYAKEMGAEAFTVGSSIFFAPGRYQPESTEGQALIGHELTHVVQQANLPALTDRAIPETSSHGQAMEHEAQHNERLLLNHLTNQPSPVMRVSGETQLSIPVPPTPAPVVQRSFEPLPPVHIRQEVSRQEELPPGSTVQRVITNEISNSLSNASSEGLGQSGGGGNGNAKIDIDEITEQVYRRLRQRLIVERERGGPSGGRFF